MLFRCSASLAIATTDYENVTIFCLVRAHVYINTVKFVTYNQAILSNRIVHANTTFGMLLRDLEGELP
jgi:hypothetical protein